mgnify:CR=1 FL=1
MIKFMSKHKNNLVEELIKLLEEQNPKDLDEIFDLVAEMIKKHKHYQSKKEKL